MSDTRTTVNARSMKCEGCASAVRAALQKLPGVTQVDVDLTGKTVTVVHGDAVDRTQVTDALTRAGFPSD